MLLQVAHGEVGMLVGKEEHLIGIVPCRQSTASHRPGRIGKMPIHIDDRREPKCLDHGPKPCGAGSQQSEIRSLKQAIPLEYALLCMNYRSDGALNNKLQQYNFTMASASHPQSRRPRVAVTLGDPAGIGPEVIAKILSDPRNIQSADIFLLADQVELDGAVKAAGHVEVPISSTAGPDGFQLLDDMSASSFGLIPAQETSKSAGQRAIHQLRRAIELARNGQVDAIVFAPLNKSSLKAAGMHEEDELRWFAKQLSFTGTTSEINICGDLWTARVTSHVGIENVAGLVTKESALKAIELLHRLR